MSRNHEALFFAPPSQQPLPVVVVTGFLGSGKTTLLQRLLAARGNLRVAAVVHDLADLNVDAQLLASASEKAVRRADVAQSDGAVVPLSGCACCPGFEDLLAGLVKASLRDGVDQGMLDYICLETSGAADPRRLIALLEKRFGPTARARLDRVVAVVDADHLVALGPPEVPAQTWEAGILRAQLSCSDVVVLNKVDLLTEEARAAAAARLEGLCPHARVLSCSYGAVALTELLEVREAPSAGIGNISHEAAAANWIVSEEVAPRPARAAAPAESRKPLAAAFSGGCARAPGGCLVVEWAEEKRPVRLARLQALLGRDLPGRWGRHLRRAKGTLWVAEDREARWEWQVSGRLRYSAERAAEGFCGAAPRSALVLIFGPGLGASGEAEVRAVLAALPEPGPPLGAEAAAALRRSLVEGSPGFEVLDGGASSQVLRFRLTGRATFGIPPEADLAEPPYSVDVDAMNRELVGLVNMAQGGAFLALGSAAGDHGRPCAAMLWPLEGADSPGLFEATLEAARSEAAGVLSRRFAHVTSCRCGA